MPLNKETKTNLDGIHCVHRVDDCKLLQIGQQLDVHV